IVHIDREPACGAVGHGPVGVATHPATNIEKCYSAPVLWLERRSPAAKLSLIFGSQLGVIVPLIAKAVRRTGCKRLFGIVGLVDGELCHLQAAIEKRVSVAGNRKEAIEASSTRSSIRALVTVVFQPSEPSS